MSPKEIRTMSCPYIGRNGLSTVLRIQNETRICGMPQVLNDFKPYLERV